MATTKPTPPASPARAQSAPAPLAAGQVTPPAVEETEEAKAERLKAEEAARVEAERLAKEQHQAQSEGETGQDQANALKEGEAGDTVQHTIADPKAAPVDYTRETMRRPPHAVLPPDADEPKAVAVRPYGSEPRSIDTATGGDIETGGEDEPATEDERDADTDRGTSAALNRGRKAKTAKGSR